MRLIPLFHDEQYRFRFSPGHPNEEPVEWVWVEDGFRAFWSDVHGVELGVEPGREPRWAHEFFYRDERRGDLPIEEAPEQ